MNNEAKKKAKELIEWFMFKSLDNGIYGVAIMPIHQAKQCALKVAKSEWDALEQARVFEQHDFYLELFNEIENYE